MGIEIKQYNHWIEPQNTQLSFMAHNSLWFSEMTPKTAQGGFNAGFHEKVPQGFHCFTAVLSGSGTIADHEIKSGKGPVSAR